MGPCALPRVPRAREVGAEQEATGQQVGRRWLWVCFLPPLIQSLQGFQKEGRAIWKSCFGQRTSLLWTDWPAFAWRSLSSGCNDAVCLRLPVALSSFKSSSSRSRTAGLRQGSCSRTRSWFHTVPVTACVEHVLGGTLPCQIQCRSGSYI